MFVYGGIALAGLAFFGISLRRPESWRVNVAVAVLSAAFSIYLVELVLFLGGPGDSGLARVVKRAGIRFDPRTKYEVVKELQQQGVDAVPAVIPHDLLLDEGFDPGAAGVLPLAGISGKTTVLCNESGSYAVYVADEHGFNNPHGLHKAGAIDVALVGDSFIHGFCVPPGEDIAGQLRSAGLRALSLGIGGSGPLLELAVLTEYAVAYRPKVVLWFYFENDQIELLEEERSSILSQYLTPGYRQDLQNRQTQIDHALADFIAEKAHLAEQRSQISSAASASLDKALGRIVTLSHIRTFISARLGTQMTIPILPPTVQFQRVLATAGERVRSAGGRFYFVYLPSLSMFTESDTKYRMHRDQVLATVKALGIDTIDLLERINDSHADPLTLFAPSRPAHYSVAGYKLLRDAIVERLARDGSVTRSRAASD
jgi:hypothetical protein